MSTMVHVPTSAPVGLPIELGERCDRCISQARVRVHTRRGLLDLCKHHFERAETALMAVATMVSDQRHELNVKLGVGMPEGQDAKAPSKRRKEGE